MADQNPMGVTLLPDQVELLIKISMGASVLYATDAASGERAAEVSDGELLRFQKNLLKDDAAYARLLDRAARYFQTLFRHLILTHEAGNRDLLAKLQKEIPPKIGTKINRS